MAIQDTQAQKLLKKYAPKVADLLGAALPTNLSLQVISPEEMLKVAGSAAASATVGTTIYISSDQAASDLAGMIVYETTHAIHQAAGTGYNDARSQTAGEAMAQAVRIELGLASPDSADAQTQKFLALGPQDLQTASQELTNGTFTNIKSINTSPSPAPTGLTPGQVNKDMQPQSNDPGTINSVLGPSETGTSPPSTFSPPPPPPPPSPQGNPKNYQAAAKLIIESWGLPLTPGLQAVINKGMKLDWNKTTLQYYLEQTPEFHQAFPGIFDANGTLKMSPSDYLKTVKSYQSYAAQTGINLNAQQTAYLFRNDVSPAEFSQRAQAVTTLRTNKQYFDAFNQQLKSMGMQPLSRGDQFKFVMGEGNQEWYDIWTEASTRYSAEQAGLKFGNAAKAYTNLGEGIIKKVAGLGLTQPQMQQSFAQLAKDLQTVLPMSRIQKFGLSKQDLVELEFGGPRQAAVAAKVQQIMKNEDAFLKNQVNLAGQTGQLGVSGPRTQQPVAYGP